MARPSSSSSEDRWVGAMLAFESALAAVQARMGIVPPDTAGRIAAACAGGVDTEAVVRAARRSASPVVEMLGQVRARLEPRDAQWLHHGATTQDAVDSALMVLARDASRTTSADVRAAANACASLVREHRETPILGRTLLQDAVETTFGARAATWLQCLAGALEGLDALAFPVQLGGAVGTLPELHPRGPEVRNALADELGLDRAGVSWHTNRVPVARVAGAVAMSCGAVAKVAADVVLLAASGELHEEAGMGHGASSAMAHKRNPAFAVAASAASLRAPGLASTVLSCMAQELERAAGAWQAEWDALRALLDVGELAAAALRDSLAGLRAHPQPTAGDETSVAAGAAFAGAVLDEWSNREPGVRR